MSQDAMRERVNAVRDRIAAACARAGRDPSEVSLLPVSKTFPVDAIREAMALGFDAFGENRPQELASKAQALEASSLRWVAIGQVQTNKAKDIAQWASELQSLDRLSLAQALQRRLEPLERTLDVLVQVKTSPEDTKSGVEPEELVPFLKSLESYPNLSLKGLMTMAVLSEDEQAVRACFRLLRQCRDDAVAQGVDANRLKTLSMGMSGDMELAIEEGSTQIRVGSAIFGGRS